MIVIMGILGMKKLRIRETEVLVSEYSKYIVDESAKPQHVI
jgi:hypothetical protein